MEFMRNFGHDGPEKYAEVGINGKNSEFHAAMGLIILEDIDEIISERKSQYQYYLHLLQKKNFSYQKITAGTEYNYSYFSVLFEGESQLLRTQESLNAHGIFPRRYFFPSLNKVPYVEPSSCPHAESTAKRILCLPLYHGLKKEEQEMICNLITSVS